MTIKTPKELAKSQAQAQSHRLNILQWPVERMPQGLGLSFKDGYNFGLGMGVAFVFVLPVLIAIASCAGWLLFLLLGNWLGSML